MMSLFSSFDMGYFYSVWMVILLMSFLLVSKSYCLSSFSSTIIFVCNGLGGFFLSLKPKSFNKFSSLIFISMFFLWGLMNFFSVFSFVFPISSQVSVIFFTSLSMWISFMMFTFSNFYKKGLYHFIPEGTPLPLTFLLFLIELVSNLIRPLTLMVRLVANILAGHLLMILLCSLVIKIWVFFPFYMMLNLVEIFVALIQSYIFGTMLVLYYSEV